MMRRLTFAAAAAILVFSTAPISVSFAASSAPATPASSDADTFKALNLFADVFERVRQDYVDPVPDKKLIENAISGMLSALDPHSSYMDADAYKDMQVDTKGEFGGLGIEVMQDNGLIKIVAPIDDTPGARAGLKSGDYIVALDGQPVMNMNLQDAVQKMRGAPDTKVKLTIRREGVAPFDVTLTRAIIKVTSVRGRIEGGDIAYMRIASFKERTDEELEATFKRLKTQANGKISGVVLDLRNDPGGLLDQAVAVSASFLGHGEVVSTRGRRPDDVQRFDAHAVDMTGGLPIVVLINAGSASASEIVAGALQDHHRAVLLGTRSFGKGSVQTIIPLQQGAGALRLTTARYFTPSGRSIQAKGIEPDITVEPAKVEKLAPGMQIYESDLKGALKNPDAAVNGTAKPGGNAPAPAAKPEGTSPAGGEPSSSTAPAGAPAGAVPAGSTPASETPAGATPTKAPPALPGDVTDPSVASPGDDYQLMRAVDLLKGLTLFRVKAD